MSPSPHVNVVDLRYDLGSRTLWSGVTFGVAPGRALALRGVSGSGKSTMLRCLAGFDRGYSGSAVVLGTSLADVPERARRSLRRRDVGCIVQDHAVVPEWTVEANLRVLRLPGVGRAELSARIDQALLAVGLGGRRRARAGLMSGGEQQRVGVARVLVQQPRVVLADEPTASLDRGSAARVLDGLEVLRAAGSAVVVATHDAALAGWADEVLVLGDQ